MDNIQHLQKIIHDQVHHVIDETMAGPLAINRGIGESMRHIGAVLVNASNGYLPIRRSEIMVEPKPYEDTNKKAILIINRVVNDQNSFQIIAEIKKIDSGLEFNVTAFQPDTFDMCKTKFINLPEPMANELIRQLSVLTKKEGALNLQCIILDNFFPSEEVKDELFNSDVSAIEPSATAPVKEVAVPPEQSTGGLPPVRETGNLL